MIVTAPSARPISTVFGSQERLLQAVIALHCPDGFDLDPTFSKGVFYRGDIPRPRLCCDLAPQASDVIQADCRDLPFDAGSIGNVMFDPPFMHAHGKTSKLGMRFSSYPTQKALRHLYMPIFLPDGREWYPPLVVAHPLCGPCTYRCGVETWKMSLMGQYSEADIVLLWLAGRLGKKRECHSVR